MGFSETLELLLHADASGGISEVRKFASESGKSVSEVESNFKRLGASMMKIGGTGMAAGGFLTMIGDKERQAGAQLEAAIDGVGQSAAEYSDRIEEAIKSGENFGNTAVESKNALQKLVSSYNDTGEALDRMQLVEDLAAAKHIDLTDAAALVARAHGGAAKVFKEFGIVVEKNADGSKNMEGALDELAQKLNGQASASVSGLSGQFQILATKAEDFVAGIGESYGPAILGLSTGLTALGGIMSATGSAVTALKARHLEAAAAAEAQTLAEKAMMVGLAGGVVAAIVGGAIALDRLTDSGHQAKISVEQLAAMSGSQMRELAEGFKKASDELAGSDGINARARATGESLKNLEDQSLSNIAAAERFADQLEASGVNVDDFRAKIAATSDANVQSARDQRENSEAIEAAVDPIKAQTEALKKLNDAQQKDLDLQLQRIGGVIAVSDSEIKAREAVAELKKSTDDATLSADQHQSALNEAETAILAAAAAAGDLAETQSGLAGTTDGAVASNQAQITSLNNVLATLQPGSPLYVAVQSYIAALNSTPGVISTEFRVWASQDTRSLIESSNRLGRSVASYDVGGMVPGPRGKPQLAIVHGGEYVSTADEVANAGRGGGSSSPVPMGQGLTVYLDARGSMMTGEQVVSALHNHARSNTAPVLLKEWLAS